MPIVLLLMVFLSASGIHAYLTDQEWKENQLGIGWNDVEIKEDFPVPDPQRKEIKKEVSFTNTGPVDCFVRAKLVFSSSQIQDAVSLNLNTDDWKQETDGYYYFQRPVSSGEETDKLLYGITIEKDVEQEEKNFSLAVYVETVQAGTETDAVEAFVHLMP